jgi:chromosome segregation ATPase
MSEHEATIRDLERTVNELRNDRDEWRDLTQRALDQIEQWKLVCERWEKRYNEMMARNN